VYPPNMDTNTMIVHLVSTLALFALLVLVVLRLDVLWLRLRHFELACRAGSRRRCASTRKMLIG
jgi:hypothetical protein